MSQSKDIKLHTEEKTVTAAGTREKLKDGPRSETLVYAVSIQALASNTGNIFIGDETVASTNGKVLEPRDIIDLNCDPGQCLCLADIYIDSAVNGEGVRLTYLRDR